MKKVIAIFLVSFSLHGMCNEKPEKVEEIFREGLKSFDAYHNVAIGVWDCVSLSDKSTVSVLSLQSDYLIYYNALDKYYFPLWGKTSEKHVTLTESGLKAVNKIKQSTMADELEFDYSTHIVSFKPFASAYGNFSNYQCTKRK
ncbi:hypothetical protein KZY44_004262 [Vibrio vulnificus]|uniref:hypothetical protein n=1 Tax=Vibrio vulnificus TaxID=672 RepID=UPI00102965D2|nr:hypothetical protein [Vibrio vulnificus]EGQ7992768.1 hypothetical protein [Vibrio vulnificus]EGR0105779.1 hypothetical protein [Vibrio vulnificus]EGR7945040.1 hypothetical protein [Vibrio vulnificus]EHU9455755.1 hypothetical protein [Vibrio vulnificus]EHV9837882.1 hypothetical protein [Vibrio vulnificus]